MGERRGTRPPLALLLVIMGRGGKGLYMLVEMHVLSLSFPGEVREQVKVCAVQLGRSSSKLESTKRVPVEPGSGWPT